ncbi:MAG: hypothetical protein ACJA2J_001875 [Candidatus Azotimanducaceae bacterium]|jgi:hypothetical protein
MALRVRLSRDLRWLCGACLGNCHSVKKNHKNSCTVGRRSSCSTRAGCIGYGFVGDMADGRQAAASGSSFVSYECRRGDNGCLKRLGDQARTIAAPTESYPVAVAPERQLP